MAARGDIARRSRRWVYVATALVIAYLGVIEVSPRASRLLLINALPESERQDLSHRGISIDPLSLAEIPEVLVSPTGPEVIESILADRGNGASQIRLAMVKVSQTSLYSAWSGLAYIATIHESKGLGYEILIIGCANGSLVLDVTDFAAANGG